MRAVGYAEDRNEILSKEACLEKTQAENREAAKENCVFVSQKLISQKSGCGSSCDGTALE